MSNIDDAHEESKGSPSTIELLTSLFEEPKESKIRRVKGKTGPKSAATKSGAAVRPMKGVQQRTAITGRGRQMRLSGSETEARAIRKKTQVRKPAVPENITVKGPGIKAHVQQKGQKIVAQKRSVPTIRKNQDKRISESSVVKRERAAASEGCVRPPEASSHSQRRSVFGSTTLSIGLPFAMGVLLTLLATRLAPLYLFDGDQGIALAKKEMVTNPAPMEPDVAVSMASAATVVTAKQEVSSTNSGLSMWTHSVEAARTKTFQRDESKSYPYSVYLGSYRNIDRAQEAISIFQKKGLSPYWVRVDLGEKGVWYRILTGHFQTKDEVNAFIEKNRITEGRSRYVLYANLIGLYSSDEELREKNHFLVELGYCPYVIEGDEGESLLFTGAFYHKADAEKEHVELASKGIQSRIVKR